MLQVYGEELSEVESEVVALAFMAGRPLAVVATAGSRVREGGVGGVEGG